MARGRAPGKERPARAQAHVARYQHLASSLSIRPVIFQSSTSCIFCRFHRGRDHCGQSWLSKPWARAVRTLAGPLRSLGAGKLRLGQVRKIQLELGSRRRAWIELIQAFDDGPEPDHFLAE